ncbi:hypothetical protein [Sphingomonas sp. Root720]|uniref:hypothetical protein n=1 Tax=Sphingomonas sp. Root720 TaxID=1736595 RepID=UPI0012E33BF6|nr:hypothetical protein [Sphingomonas sp. Root720]
MVVIIALLELGAIWFIMGAMATGPNVRNMSVVATLAIVALANGALVYRRPATTRAWPQYLSAASFVLIVGLPAGQILFIALRGG